MLRRTASLPIAAALCALLATAAPAQSVDPADLAFWQSIQSSTNPAEYQAYLDAFPKGVFVEVAKLRLQQYGGASGAMPDAGAAPDATAAAAADPNGLAPVVGDGEIVLSSPVLRVGQKLEITFRDFPEPAIGDRLVVVTAGSPDTNPEGATGPGKPLYMVYIGKYDTEHSVTDVGPFAPGEYEVRWFTTLYNNEKKPEVGARTRFKVTRK